MYFIWNGFLFLVWLALLLYRRDIRKEALYVGLLFGFAGIIADFIYSADYWISPNATHTRAGIESFLFGFFIGGIASVLYMEIASMKIISREQNGQTARFAMSAYALMIIFIIGFYALNISSFYAGTIGLLLPTCLMLAKRKDLFFDSLFTGIMLLVVGITINLMLIAIQQDFIQQYWRLDGRWYMQLFFGVPLGEYIFYLTTGMFIGPFYEFWHGGKLKSLASTQKF